MKGYFSKKEFNSIRASLYSSNKIKFIKSRLFIDDLLK